MYLDISKDMFITTKANKKNKNKNVLKQYDDCESIVYVSVKQTDRVLPCSKKKSIFSFFSPTNYVKKRDSFANLFENVPFLYFVLYSL